MIDINKNNWIDYLKYPTANRKCFIMSFLFVHILLFKECDITYIERVLMQSSMKMSIKLQLLLFLFSLLYWLGSSVGHMGCKFGIIDLLKLYKHSNNKDICLFVYHIIRHGKSTKSLASWIECKAQLNNTVLLGLIPIPIQYQFE